MFRQLAPRIVNSNVLCGPRIRATRRAPACMAVSRVITPTESEEKLFKILTDTLRYRGIKSTLRCAGGWVRDKLLGLESDDIDIAIDDMLGKEFADHVNAYLTSHSLEAQKVHTSI
jgi:hypothetical protein